MDTYRGNYLDLSAEEGWPEVEFGEEETPREPPPSPVGQDERRMQVRAYNHWAGLLGERSFPSIEELDPADLRDFGPYSVLLDFTGGIENPAVAFLGDQLARECGSSGPIRTLADVPARSLLSRITDHYMQILANQAPIGFEAEFVSDAGRTLLYRGILLPFSSDDETIDFIYGVINWKELADQATTDELMLEIEQALDAGRLGLGPGTASPSWADGPAAMAERTSQETFEEVLELATAEPDLATPDDAAVGLGDRLATARALAEAARGSEDRTRHALYAAIGTAYDFALAAAQAPEEFAELVAESGLTIQDRAPMTPVVKLVFGADYDKTRLTEFATALNHAQRIGVEPGTLARFLSEKTGGLKAVVSEERRLKREEKGKAAAPRTSPRDALARQLRQLDHAPLSAVSPEGSEFTLLVARRLPGGEAVLLGEVADDVALLEKAVKKLLC